MLNKSTLMLRLQVPSLSSFKLVLREQWLGAVLGFFLLTLVAIFSVLILQSYRQWSVFEDRYQRGCARLCGLEGDVAAKEAYVNAFLRDPAFTEHVARERLGYAKEAELIFRFRKDGA